MSAKLTRAALSRAVARRLGLPQAAAGAHVAALIELVAAALGRGQSLSLRGFGSLKVKARPARRGRHPRSGHPLDVAARTTVVFRPAARGPPAGEVGPAAAPST